MAEPKKPLLKVVILGDGGVGKSCLMNRYITDHFDESSFHTIGVEFLSKDVDINGTLYTLQIWDTAGQERFKSLRTPFYRGSDVCLLVCSVDDRRGFDSLSQWRSEFLHYADINDPASFPFAVLANKNDLPQDKWEVTEEEVSGWCAEAGGLPCLLTSAKTAHNVQQAFTLAVSAWAEREASHVPQYSTQTVSLAAHKKAASNTSCCNSS